MTDTTPGTASKATKVGVSKGRRSRLIHAWVGERADADLAAIHARYAALLDRPVSTSVLIRRALDLLADHTATQLKTPYAADRELAAVARCAA